MKIGWCQGWFGVCLDIIQTLDQVRSHHICSNQTKIITPYATEGIICAMVKQHNLICDDMGMVTGLWLEVVFSWMLLATTMSMRIITYNL